MMRSRGLSIIYPIVTSCFIYAGAMEFVTVELLLAQFDPIRAFLMTLMINARHLFYGIYRCLTDIAVRVRKSSV